MSAAKSSKGMVLYSAVYSLSDCSNRFRFTPNSRPVPYDTNLTSLGKHSAMMQLLRRNYFRIFALLACNLFILQRELGRREKNENDQTSKQQQRGFKLWAFSVDIECGVPALSHCKSLLE